MKTAICRAISSSFAQCELTHIDRVPIDIDRARAQHHAYEALLVRLGVQVIVLPEEPNLPDSVFVEDTALVLDEIAVMLRPGAVSRRPEVPSVAKALQEYRPLVFIDEPATLDGGDILRIGKKLFVGLSTRSGPQGIEALTKLVKPHGYDVQGVPLQGCLHLKSAATLIAEDRLIVNPEWVDPALFRDVDRIAVDPDEPHAANALLIGHHVVYASAYPRTSARIAKFVSDIHCLDVSELAKAEGAVTCCSLLIESRISTFANLT